ncbi:hypothetical protein [Malikia sp.]|uniref:hypothetical protein n=1 Tax=Malikia sp. TaxID=2070706 RepID=UPI00261EA8E1|nr:hypothetical protein [Malikia sp.]MDD2728307.1 hypothetical protein [Malikia sp.]
MRPASEVRTALLQAVRHCHGLGQSPTLLELAHQAQVGVAAATHTVKNLRRAGLLQICGTRRVAYRNRPVAEYAPVSQPIELAAVHSLQSTLHSWVKP